MAWNQRCRKIDSGWAAWPEDRISPSVSRSPEPRPAPCTTPARNSHGIVQALSAETPPQLHLQNPTHHQQPVLSPETFLISLSPSYFSPTDGSLFEDITHTTHLYVYLTFSFCDKIPNRSHWRRNDFLVTQTEGRKGVQHCRSKRGLTGPTLLTVRGGERKTTQFSQLPPYQSPFHSAWVPNP